MLMAIQRNRTDKMKYKQLIWTKVPNRENLICARSPIANTGAEFIFIKIENNMCIPSWDTKLITSNFQLLKDNAQQLHENWLAQWINNE